MGSVVPWRQGGEPGEQVVGSVWGSWGYLGGSAWPEEAVCHKLSSGRKCVKSKQIREEVKGSETFYPGPWRANCVFLGPVVLWTSIFSSSKVRLYYLRAILALVSLIPAEKAWKANLATL